MLVQLLVGIIRPWESTEDRPGWGCQHPVRTVARVPPYGGVGEAGL